jgi:integrase
MVGPGFPRMGSVALPETGSVHTAGRMLRCGPDQVTGANRSESGGIGRRAGFRIQWGNPWGFESPLSHFFPGMDLRNGDLGASVLARENWGQNGDTIAVELGLHRWSFLLLEVGFLAMASLEKRSGRYRISFRFGGQKFSRSLRTKDEREARASLARLEDNVRRSQLGTLMIPEGADIPTYLLSDGNLSAKPTAQACLTLEALLDEFFDTLPVRSLEQSTVAGMKIHRGHLLRILGPRFQVRKLTPRDLQGYVKQRSTEEGLRGRRVTGETIKKAIVTLQTVWHWGVTMDLLEGPFPNDSVKYPKATEKPPFQTCSDIRRQIEHRGLAAMQQQELWGFVFLSVPEIAELLAYVKQVARQPFIYPMSSFAAHTGSRRAEMLRSKRDDIDFRSNTVTIHERKRSRQKRTTRRVPMSSFLRAVLSEWLDHHPGGEYTFCHTPHVPRRKTNRNGSGALTPHMAHDHFKRTVADSKWSMLRGWHVFRHSFCSNCAAGGIDQRIINGWVGHQSEQMVRRYRHLFPDQQQQAMELVFGKG